MDWVAHHSIWHAGGTRSKCSAIEVSGFDAVFDSSPARRARLRTSGSREMKRILLALVLCSSLVAIAADDDRYNDVGNKIQCSCGCGQILIKCNHVGCQSSDTMIRELRAALTNYKEDEDVFNWFRRNYGTTVVVVPATHGFELNIWLAPVVLVVCALLIMVFIMQRWRLRGA